MLTPPGPSFFPMTLTVSASEVNHLLSAICKKKQNKKQKTTKALERLLPFPHPKVGLPKLFFCFFLVLFKDLIPRINPD
jgi:Fe2+ transport system protein B